MKIKLGSALCAAAIAVAACLAFSGCNADGGENDKTTTKRAVYTYFGTAGSLVISADFSDSSVKKNLNTLNNNVVSFLSALESSISSSAEGSCIYYFNRAAAGESVKIDKTAYEVLSLAKSVYTLTGGYYNPAVFYSVDLYGFAPGSDLNDYPRVSDGSMLPKEEYVSAFRELSAHFADVDVFEENGEYIAVKPADACVTVGGLTYNLKVDLGGIGKGYAADRISELMEEAGFEYGYFDFGSSSMAVRKSYFGEDNRWSLGLLNPRGSGSYAYIKAASVNLSTSGDYEKFFIEDGVRYCHIIDPTTGSPVQTGIASCTVIGGTAAEDDALTTALTAMGKDRAIKFINDNLSDRKVVFTYIRADGKIEIYSNCAAELYNIKSGFTVIEF